MNSLEHAQNLESTVQDNPEEGIVLVVEHNIVGQVSHVYEPNQYISPLNGKPVPSCVLELDGGHAFHFDGNAPVDTFVARFQRLVGKEKSFLLATMGAVDEVTRGSAALARSMGVPPTRALLLLLCAFQRAVLALRQPSNPRRAPVPAPTLPSP